MGVQGSIEVPRLAVDVDIESIEGGASLEECLGHHGAGMGEQFADLGRRQSLTRPVEVEPGPPQGLIGIDVAHTPDEPLIKEQSLDPGGTTSHTAYELVVVELDVDRVARDMGDLGRQFGAGVGHQQSTEHALVDETKLPGNREAEAHAQVTLIGGPDVLDEHLPTHAEVTKQRIGVVQRQPEVLAAATHGLNPAADQGVDETRWAAWIATYGTWVQDLD